jgi:hypothetical protein
MEDTLSRSRASARAKALLSLASSSLCVASSLSKRAIVRSMSYPNGEFGCMPALGMGRAVVIGSFFLSLDANSG